MGYSKRSITEANLTEKTKQGIGKAKAHNWGPTDEPGTLEFIPKTKLIVDKAYQRDAIAHKIGIISKNWSWVACGVITVGKRDGKLWVIDGQHRTLAALKNSNVKELPCIVFNTIGQKKEARGFYDVNNLRKAMSAMDKFRALLVAGDDSALYLKNCCDQLGIEIVPCPSTGKQMKCVAKALALVQSNKIKFNEIITFCDKLCGVSEIISDIILSGIAYIHNNYEGGLDDKRLSARLLDAGPVRLTQGAKKARDYRGGASGGASIYAEGMFDVINKGLKIKFVLK